MSPLIPDAKPIPIVRAAPARPPALAVAGRPAAPAPGDDEAAWRKFLEAARALPKEAILPPVAAAPGPESLPPEQAQPLREALLLVPARPEPGVARAIADLETYLGRVTGGRVRRHVVRPGAATPAAPAGATVIAVGDAAVGGAAGGTPGAYRVAAARDGQATRITLDGADLGGRQRAIYRFMELSGARFFSYADRYEPPTGEAVAPAPGFVERYAPPADMRVRGFAPHLYHPIPLSIAFHEPSPAHLEMVTDYIDWLAATGQTYVKLELLELDAKNRWLPIIGDAERYEAWLPHARAILAHAHQRGIRVSLNVAVANYVSKNVFAINPFKAAWQSFRLERLRAKIARAEGPAARARAEAAYRRTLDRFAAEGKRDIGRFVDKLMRAPWDEISWCLGTSEFTPTSDDLTVRWLDAAAAHLREKHPGVKTSAVSHVPGEPRSAAYGDSYFNLVRFTDPAVGMLVHTTHAYGLLDPAPVYGNRDFVHKLRLMFRATPEREDVFYPESSYWVTHDADVPLFLPVYMLNRRHDMELVRRIPDVDGHVTFTTAWEWGYWLTDYAAARMQARPELDLTQILDGAFAPLGAQREPMTRLMREVLLGQQRRLIDEGLIRHVQGHDALSDLGASAMRNPLLKHVVHGANNIPMRVSPGEIARWDRLALHAFERGELARLGAMAEEFAGFARRARAIAEASPPAGRRYAEELADGLEINALRARQVHAALHAAVLARRAALGKDPAARARARERAAEAARLVDQALVVIRRREAGYREAPEYTHVGDGPTMWPGRYLSRTHVAAFWKRTADEAAKAVE